MVVAPIVQGRSVSPDVLEEVRALIGAHRGWSRRRLALELCDRWQWRNAAGQVKDMAARTFLNKLEQRGWIELPPRQQRGGPGFAPPVAQLPEEDPEPIGGDLKDLRPLQIHRLSARKPEAGRFNAYLARYHYLPWRSAVGENVAYLVQDRTGRDLACVLFGAAAWKTRPRDQYIGWRLAQRRAGLELIANNSRFLILPGVRVAHLASHILGAVSRRLGADWRERYGHSVALLETFVERDRFAGTCYRAANWVCVGQTQGRTRQDRHRNIEAPVKDVYLYPLRADFRKELCRGS
jgi:hypothetical protein